MKHSKKISKIVTKPDKRTMKYLDYLSCWVKVITKSGKVKKGKLIQIDAIRRTLRLHSDKLVKVRYKDIDKIIREKCDMFELPSWYKKRLKREGAQAKEEKKKRIIESLQKITDKSWKDYSKQRRK